MVGLVLVCVLIVAMGHSYHDAVAAAWDTVLQLLSLLGAACVMGPGHPWPSSAREGRRDRGHRPSYGHRCGCECGALGGLHVRHGASSATFQSFQYYFDPTLPDVAMRQSEQITGAFWPASMRGFWLGNVAIGCAVPAVLAALVMTGKIPAEKALAVAVVAWCAP